INGLPTPCLCALPGSARHRDPLSLRAIWEWGTPIALCEVPIHVITDWPISDHMNSSKQDVTS
ncbi:unnamed protein product, partial [Staurois parvus]